MSPSLRTSVRQGIPLRAFFSLPMLALFVLSGALLIALSFFNANQMAQSYAEKLARQASVQAQLELKSVLSTPLKVNSSSHDAFVNKVIPWQTPMDLASFFSWNMQANPKLTYLSIGFVDGRYLGVQRKPGQASLNLLTRWPAGDHTLQLERLKEQWGVQQHHILEESFDVTSRSWFKRAASLGKSSWYPPYDYLWFEGQGMGLSTPLYDANGELEAVLSADISLELFQHFINELSEHVGASLLLLDANDQVLVKSQTFTPEGNMNVLLQTILSQSNNNHFMKWGEQTYLVHISPFSDAAGIELSIVVLVSHEKLMQPAYQSQQEAGWLMSATVLMLTFVGWVLSRQLTQPVLVLQRWAKNIEQGSSSQEPLPRSSIREINSLSQALAQMAARLDKSFLQLSQKIEVDTSKLQRLSVALNRTSNSVLLLDANGQIEWVNQAFEQLVELSKEELQGFAIQRVLVPVIHPQTSLEIEKLLATGSGFCKELLYQLTSERQCWLRLECDDVRNEQGELIGFVLLCLDIHSRKEGEAAALESQVKTGNQRAALTQLVLNEALAQGDSSSLAQELVKLTASALQCRRVSVWLLSAQGDEMFCLALYQEGELLSQGPMMLRQKDCPSYFETLESEGWIRADDITSHASMVELQAKYLQPLGVTSALDAAIRLSGKVVGVISLEHQGEARHWQTDEEAFVSSVAALMAQTLMAAQRKDAELISKESAQHMQTVLNNVVDGIITIDESGRIASMNPAAQLLFESSADVLAGHYAIELLSPKCQSEQPSARYFPLPGYIPVLGQNRELEGQKSNGKVFAIEMAMSKTQRQGRVLYICTLRDISDRKRVEQLKSEFVSTVSHELRTPLTSIVGALGLLENGVAGALTDQSQQLVQIAYKNSQRLSMLINDLLDIEKIAAGKMQYEFKVELIEPLVQQALELNRMLAQSKNIQVRTIELTPQLCVLVDAKRLIQVLSNFLSNAIKFSPVRAEIQVCVERIDEAVQISITDQGSGISPAFAQQVFTRFSQADSSDTRQSGGTGLGLAISKELVEGMSGQIGFVSEPGQGATFYCRFPLIE